MKVFSGAGGLAVDLDQSEAVITEWAIEIDTLASHPSAKVYNHDANVLLRRAIEEYLGTNRGPLMDLVQKPLPRMLWPGEVDFLYGGPPCQDFFCKFLPFKLCNNTNRGQNFKKCNQYQKANSIKNSLLTTYLSYVDHYRPGYFLLMNVQDLLSHQLGSTQVNIHTTRGGIEMASAKFIIRALTLGCQVQFSVLQAAEHGTPQSRLRIFIWGSKPGYPLPKYPDPTHFFAGRTPKPTRRAQRSVPHHSVTVGDAISDLPAFDWTMDIPGESAIERAARDRRAENITQVPLLEGFNVKIGADIQVYSSRLILSEYQRELRWNLRATSVQNHYTCRWSDETLIRIMRIPMRPGANHLNLPPGEDM
jgi:DNA (cytosine-5)-methyltransferase 1